MYQYNKIELFQNMCTNHYFEREVARAHSDGKIKIPIYLSLGQDHIPACISQVFPQKTISIFGQHRCHSWYMSYGGSLEKLRDELLGLPTGCNGGMGGSPSISNPDANMFGHSGMLGDQIPIAVGYAIVSNKTTLAVMGDGAAEEDYVLGAMGYAVTKNAPVLFIIEDNNLAVLTELKVRRSWSLVDVANGFGMNAIEISDTPDEIIETVSTIKLPALVNIKTNRELWHSGSGCDGPLPVDRFNQFAKLVASECTQDVVDNIKSTTKERVGKIWEEV